MFADAGTPSGGFTGFWNSYLNYPGFEVWRFVNLGIFIAILVYFLKRPLSEAFKAKREAIRADLIKAEAEKQAALDRLTAAEARLVGLDAERNAVLARARQEAEAEKARIAESAVTDVKRIREQASSEIARLAQQTRNDLRRFSADESIRIAEEKLRAAMTAEKDAQLVRSGIDAIGGLS